MCELLIIGWVLFVIGSLFKVEYDIKTKGSSNPFP